MEIKNYIKKNWNSPIVYIIMIMIIISSSMKIILKKNTTQMKVDNIKYVVSSSNDFIGKIVNDTKFGIFRKTSLKIFHYHQQTITLRRKKRKKTKIILLVA